MKKLAILFLVIIFSQCQIKIEPKSVSAADTPIYSLNKYRTAYRMNYLNVSVYNKDGMEYRIFTINGESGGGVDVVNHTKELLEVELLSLQINKLKNK